jgi:hypothetical protein
MTAGTGLKVVLCGIIAGLLFCTSAGYVLHVDNKLSVPYTAVDVRLKQRVVHALIRHRLVTAAQAATCSLNIMEIDRYYVVEVWPDGVASGNRFSIRLKRPYLFPSEKYAECPGADSCGRSGEN